MFEPRQHVTRAATALLMVSLSGSAMAGHGVAKPAPPRGFDTAKGEGSAVRMDVSSSRFDTDFMSGSFWSLAVSADVDVRGWGLHLRVPMHTLDANSERTTGLGDAVLGVRKGLNVPRVARLDIAVDAALPTGNSDDGLGTGTLTLLPRVTAVRPLTIAVDALAVVSGAVSSGEGQQVIVEQRSDAEIYGGLGAAASWKRLRASGLVGVTRVVAPDMAANTYVTVAPSLSVELWSGWWARAFAELPLGAERRLEWHAGVGVAFNWGRPVDPESIPHTHGPDGRVHPHTH